MLSREDRIGLGLAVVGAVIFGGVMLWPRPAPGPAPEISHGIGGGYIPAPEQARDDDAAANQIAQRAMEASNLAAARPVTPVSRCGGFDNSAYCGAYDGAKAAVEEERDARAGDTTP